MADMLAAAKFIDDDPELRKKFASSSVSGLGTGATRAEIIEKLKTHKLMVASGKTLEGTPKGIAYIAWLKEVYPAAVDVALTAQWEAELGEVAVKGGGKAFEERTYDQIRKMVEIFKAAPPLTGFASTATTEKSSMSESSAPTYAKPTEGMVRFAHVIARNLGQPLPPEVETDAAACRTYIDTHKDTAMRPSPKQIEFAQSIAQRKGITVPEDVLTEGRKVSKWIDENK